MCQLILTKSDVSFVLAKQAQKLFIRHGCFSFSFAWFPPYGAAPVWGCSAASAVLHSASRRASVGAFPACSNGWGSLSRRACCLRAETVRAAVWRIPAVHCTPDKAPRPLSLHAPAIPAHHEGNSFDLLFLVQALSSFLLCISVSHL